jgi:drug/metabolite transporter (DMT)-like permease
MGYFWALSLLDASIAAMLFAVSPLFTLGVLALGGEPLTRRNLLRMFLALSGVYLLIGPGGDVNPLGVLLIGVSVVAFGLQVVLIQWYLRGYDARTITLYMTAGMWMGLSIFWLVQGMPWVSPGYLGWAAILVLAVVSTYLARLALFGAVARIGGAQVAMMTPLEILLTVIWSLLFLGERLTTLQWLGGLLILASAALAVQWLGHWPARLRRGRTA